METTNSIQDLINSLPDNERELLSDGYHSFKELYEHRVTLFIALANNHTIKKSYTKNWK